MSNLIAQTAQYMQAFGIKWENVSMREEYTGINIPVLFHTKKNSKLPKKYKNFVA